MEPKLTFGRPVGQQYPHDYMSDYDPDVAVFYLRQPLTGLKKSEEITYPLRDSSSGQLANIGEKAASLCRDLFNGVEGVFAITFTPRQIEVRLATSYMMKEVNEQIVNVFAEAFEIQVTEIFDIPRLWELERTYTLGDGYFNTLPQEPAGVPEWEQVSIRFRSRTSVTGALITGQVFRMTRVGNIRGRYKHHSERNAKVYYATSGQRQMVDAAEQRMYESDMAVYRQNVEEQAAAKKFIESF